MARSLAQLTSRDAVLAAIQECDELGRDEFLRRHGYGYSRLYPLRHEGRTYDSKAIAGVAYGKQHGSPLSSREFSGGEATVVLCLSRLGFDARRREHPERELVVGKTYFRKDLIEWFGGQLQSGIWTPREFPVVFMFSGDSGHQYGYRDGWTDDGVYRYTGEGQTGDMTFTGGNKAIRHHRDDGKDLLLFEDLGKGKGVQYVGMFDCAGYDMVDAPDKDQRTRKAIVFSLVPVTTEAPRKVDTQTIRQASSKTSIDVLRALAYAAASDAPTPSGGNGKRSWYERSETVKRYVLARAAGVCEACRNPAPFNKKDGTAYLEPHHTKRLSDEGPDHPAWVAAICPNCHRRIHSGEDGEAWNRKLQGRLEEIEVAK